MAQRNCFKILSILLLLLLPALVDAVAVDCVACTQDLDCVCKSNCTGFSLSLYSAQDSLAPNWKKYSSMGFVTIPASQLATSGMKYLKVLCDSGEQTTLPLPVTARTRIAAGVCGNKICEPKENTEICCTDCGCSNEDMECANNTCKYKSGEKPAFGGCGNNKKESQEQCDGTDSKKCPGFCREDCTCPFMVDDGRCDAQAGETYSISKDCPAPACGNNKVDAGEQCDGTAPGFCPGLCKASCQCFIAGDGKCEKKAGENSNNSSDCRAAFFTWPIILLLLLLIIFAMAIAIYFLKIKPEQEAEDFAQAQRIRIPAKPAVAPLRASQLSNYVADMLNRGYTPEQIKGQLRLAGWPEDKIGEALAS